MEVKCKKCNATVILTNDDALENWKKHGEICFRCKWKNKVNKKESSAVVEISKDNVILDDIRGAFEALVENYQKQNKLYTEFYNLIDKYYGKDETWFTDFLYMECEFTQYFEDLRNLNKKDHWSDFKEWMDKFEEIRKNPEAVDKS